MVLLLRDDFAERFAQGKFVAGAALVIGAAYRAFVASRRQS